jgi:hypothetical protein
MKIKDLEKEHENSSFKCEKCSKCFCTGCILERAGGKNQGFDIIDKKIYCSKHRHDKIEVVYLPSIYKD